MIIIIIAIKYRMKIFIFPTFYIPIYFFLKLDCWHRMVNPLPNCLILFFIYFYQIKDTCKNALFYKLYILSPTIVSIPVHVLYLVGIACLKHIRFEQNN